MFCYKSVLACQSLLNAVSMTKVKNVAVIKLYLVQSTPECIASKPAAQSCVRQLVSLHDFLHHVDRQGRHIPLRKAVVNAIKVAISTG